MNEKTIFSVITVVLNDVEHIEQTIISVIAQSYLNIEYIIIDGGSSDGTIEVIKKYQDLIANFISEKDEGIYFAMNKGIKNAKGDYIIFINSGDLFYNNEVISNIVKIPNYPDIIYGANEVRYSNQKKIIRNKTLRFDFGMNVCHQAIFAKRQLLLENLFDTFYKIAADTKFIYESYNTGKTFFKTSLIISTVSSGGLSDNNKLAIREFYEIKRGLNSNLKWTLLYWYNLLKLNLKNSLKLVLPSKIIQMFQLTNSRLLTSITLLQTVLYI